MVNELSVVQKLTLAEALVTELTQTLKDRQQYTDELRARLADETLRFSTLVAELRELTSVKFYAESAHADVVIADDITDIVDRACGVSGDTQSEYELWTGHKPDGE